MIRIAWDKIARGGYRFAYIKASEGAGYKDPLFQRNWAQARKAGLVRGAYHFFTFCKPGLEQAANFIETVPAEPDALAPAVDFEFVGNCAARPPQDAVLRELSQMVDALRAKYGKEPVLYVTPAAYAGYLKGRLTRPRLWVRDVYAKPAPLDGFQWTLWQYADNVRLEGLEGPFDQNVFRGDEKDFLEFQGAPKP